MIWGLCSENETCDALLSLRWLFCHSVVSDSVTSWTAARQASLSFTLSQGLFKLMSIELVMPSNHLILCHSFLLPSIFPRIKVFPNESVLHIRCPKYWSFSFSISPSNEYSGLSSLGWNGWISLQSRVHKCGVICISEVSDISPRNLDSSLCFIQPSFSYYVLCI